MKILHTVEFYSPSLGGAQEVVKQISRQLVKRGHTVTVATTKMADRTSRTIEGVNVEEFTISGNAVRGFQGETDRYQRFIQTGDFDVMMNYAAQQWATDLVFPILDQIRCGKVLAPCGFSALAHPDFSGYFQQMPSIMSKYDHLIFHSERYRDTDFARAHSLARYTIIPNGASEQEFLHADGSFRLRYGIREDTPLLLTVGNHNGEKGHDLTIEAFRRARIGRSVLVVVGKVFENEGCGIDCGRRAKLVQFRSLGRKRVLLLDLSRTDVVAAFRAADLFVFASNLECSPLVLFEAMASRTAFITTACGNAEEIVDWSGGGLVIPTHQEPNGHCFGDRESACHMIEELIRNPHQRKRLADSGYEAWRKRFTWERIAGEYERVYESVARLSNCNSTS
jgi:glycosyltransferase involved in cell wall biosynthesis